MEELIGKTITKAEQISDRNDHDEHWVLTCSDGTRIGISACGAAYCSAYLDVGEVNE